MFHKFGATLFICPFCPDQVSHDAPERVLRMGIVLPCLEGALPGQAAEYQDSRIAASDRSKAARR